MGRKDEVSVAVAALTHSNKSDRISLAMSSMTSAVVTAAEVLVPTGMPMSADVVFVATMAMMPADEVLISSIMRVTAGVISRSAYITTRHA